MTPRERLVTRPATVSMEEAERAMFEHRVEKLPLVDEQNRVRGLVTMRDLKLHKQKPHSTKDARGRLRVGATIGAHGDYLERAAALVEQEVDVLLLDVAHADSDLVADALGRLRPRFARVPLVVGNVATAQAARWLQDLGADAIKVGVGPGRGCRTRLETSAGVPQLQAVREAWLATGGRTPIIADGGVKDDKDLFLAIACGASTVMLGSMLSGTDEAPGLIVEDPATRQKMKLYRGMTSPEAVVDAGRRSRRAGRGAAHAGRGPVGAGALRRQRGRHPGAAAWPPAVGRQLRGRGQPARRPRQDRTRPGLLPGSAVGGRAARVVRALSAVRRPARPADARIAF